MKKSVNSSHCINCGAPVTSKICPYCKAETGFKDKNVEMEYPVIDCKKASINILNFGLPLFIAIDTGFFLFSFFVILIVNSYGSGNFVFSIFLLIIFLIIIIGIFSLPLLPVIRVILINTKGKDVDATVYGYMDDVVLVNKKPMQIAKLLVSTNEGLKFIL
jgi:hypothetical protein